MLNLRRGAEALWLWLSGYNRRDDSYISHVGRQDAPARDGRFASHPSNAPGCHQRPFWPYAADWKNPGVANAAQELFRSLTKSSPNSYNYCLSLEAGGLCTQ